LEPELAASGREVATCGNKEGQCTLKVRDFIDHIYIIGWNLSKLEEFFWPMDVDHGIYLYVQELKRISWHGIMREQDYFQLGQHIALWLQQREPMKIG
jgi:hypothetical protein